MKGRLDARRGRRRQGRCGIGDRRPAGWGGWLWAGGSESPRRAGGELMNVSTAENPDRMNTTAAKRKFSVTIGPISQVEARETRTLQSRAKDVAAAYQKVLAALQTPAAEKRAIPVRIRTSQLN